MKQMVDVMEAVIENFPVKRVHKRKFINGRVGCLFNSRYFFGEALSISEGGMLLRCSQSLEVGLSMELHVSVPQDNFLILGATILYRLEEQWKQGSLLIGVKFDDMSSGDSHIVRQYVNGPLS